MKRMTAMKSDGRAVRPAFGRGLPVLAALFLLIGTTVPAFARDMPETFADLVEKLSPAVVNISSTQTIETSVGRSPFPPGSPFEEFFEEFLNRRGQNNESEEPQQRRLQSLGSGFIISADGLIVTNNHVIADADEITVRTGDGDEYEAEVVGRDSEGDLALLKVDAGKPLPFVNWGDSDAARVGDWVLAIGNPFGLGGSVTSGIISAHHRVIGGGDFDDFIQTDASINRGNSGGPLFNLKGEVVGVNSAIFSPTGGNVGIGFAIPANQAKRVIEQIEKYGYARRGYLGVTITAVDRLTAEALGLSEASGALVNSVTPDSPAEKAGIENGDVIVSFNGKTVKNSNELVRMVSSLDVGEKARLEILRGGAKKTIDIVTAERPRPEEPAAESAKNVTSELGLELSNITTILRRELNIPDDVSGAVVMRVSPAMQQRIARGDVITEVNNKPVDSVAAVRKEIAAVRELGRSAVLLRVWRNGSLFYIPVPLDAK